MPTGHLIVVEGMPLSGKSIAADAAANGLRPVAKNVALLRYPEGTPQSGAKRLLEHLRTDPALEPPDLMTRAMLYLADFWHLWQDVKSLLDEGTWVVCENWYYDVAVENSYSGGFSLIDALRICHDLRIPDPDLLIWTDITYENYKRHVIEDVCFTPEVWSRMSRQYDWALRGIPRTWFNSSILTGEELFEKVKSEIGWWASEEMKLADAG